MSKTKTINGKDYRWDYQKKKWVQSHGGSGFEAISNAAKSLGRTILRIPDQKDLDAARRIREARSKNNSSSKPSSSKPSSSKGPVSDHAKTGHTKLVKGSDGKVRRVKVSDTTKDKTIKGSDTSKTMKGKDQGDGGRADWLHKTRNSPAAKAGFSEEERWALQQKHRKWKADRKAKGEAKKHANKGSGRKGSFGKGTHGKGLPSNPQLKTQTTKDNRDPNRHTLKVTNEKNTGPTKLIKGPDGKVRRVKA